MFDVLAASSGGSVLFYLIYLIVVVVEIAAMWMMFQKAGQPGWAAIIPIYNTYVLLKIVGRPAWWIILFLIPIVSFIVWIIVALDLAKSFGKGTGFGVASIFFPYITIPILGFGDAQYQGPSAGTPAYAGSSV